MNKLTSNLFTKRSWGSEIIWALTDGYMAKTIELPKNTQSPLFLNDEKDKSIIIIMGHMNLSYGINISEMKSYILSEGWSWHIDIGMVYQYQSLEEPLRLIEVSTPHLENNTIILGEDSAAIFTPPPEDFIPKEFVEVKPKRKRVKKK
jgi:hypothetical protein